jgi:transcription elongation factor Elf1
MLVWGTGRRLEPLAQLVALDECPACANRTVLHLGVLKKDFRLYWIPVARWSSAFFVFCGVCGASYEVDKALGQKIYTQLKTGNGLTDQQTRQLLGQADSPKSQSGPAATKPSQRKLNESISHNGEQWALSPTQERIMVWRPDTRVWEVWISRSGEPSPPRVLLDAERFFAEGEAVQKEGRHWAISPSKGEIMVWEEGRWTPWKASPTGPQPPNRMMAQVGMKAISKTHLEFLCTGCNTRNKVSRATLSSVKCGRCRRTITTANPFTTLGLTSAATQDDVETAYSTSAFIYHPDRNRDAPERVRRETDRKMKAINEAKAFFDVVVWDESEAPPP